MVKIIADSTCDLSEALIERYHIDILPLYIHMGEKEYKDGKEISPPEIYRWADENNTTPKTSAPSIEDVEEFILRYQKMDMDIVMFAISEDMSTTAPCRGRTGLQPACICH